MIVIAVEETAFLAAMHRIVRSIEVDDQLIGRFGIRGNELLQHQFVNIDGDLAINPVLQPTKRRLAAQHLLVFDRTLQGRIDAQCLVIVQIFITQAYPVDTLS